MKSFFLLLLFILNLNVAFSSVKFTKYWNLKKDGTNLKSYNLRVRKDVYASFYRKKIDPNRERLLMFNDEKMQDILSTKKKMMTFLGISNWKVRQYKFIKKNDLLLMELEGNYTDRKKIGVQFKEWILYFINYQVELLVIYPEKITLEKDMLESFVDYFSKRENVK